MRSRGRFGVVLHRENRKFFVAKAFNGLIVQIDVRNLEIGGTRYPLFISSHRKPVILRRDEDSSGLYLANRVISASMPIGHFDRFGTKSEPQDLVPQADTENRRAISRDFLHGGRSVSHGRGIARPI